MSARAPADVPPTEQGRLRIDVWSDVVCPFCWIGKRHLEEALRRQGIEQDTDVVFHAFELNPAASGTRPLREHLQERFGPNASAMIERVEAMGAPSGLDFRFDKAVAAPSFDAHRLILLARANELDGALVERLMRAHFHEGRDISGADTLRALAVEMGLASEDVARVLAGDELTVEVREDEAQAHEIGVQGVPFFVLDRRFAVTGAQPVEVFEKALETARAARDAPPSE